AASCASLPCSKCPVHPGVQEPRGTRCPCKTTRAPLRLWTRGDSQLCQQVTARRSHSVARAAPSLKPLLAEYATGIWVKFLSLTFSWLAHMPKVLSPLL